MPKEARPLGQDRPLAKSNFPGVTHHNQFPKADLSVGLDHLLSGMDEEESPSSVAPAVVVSKALPEEPLIPEEGFAELPVSLIDAAPWQPRIYFSQDALDRLVASIRSANQVNRPLLVRRKDDGRFELIGGERRWRAVQILGWESLHCRIVSASDLEARLLALSDNEGQEGLTDYERGRAFKELLADGTAESERKLAVKVGVGHMIVNRCLALTKLPEACLELLEKDPTLLGNTVAPEFYKLSQTYPELAYQALLKIDQEGMKQDHALKWFKDEASKLAGVSPKKRTVPERSFSFGKGLAGSMVVTKKSIKLSVPDGVDISDLESHLLSLLQIAE
ncbi:ParB/RepB/Spo0J family partition protein [Pseudomonas sp. GOM6]|uniref:ParB/RepB/Spo0J family partition protein n=1 Tax=Pseudomonas sp. GOM6 TaxID=3036944 RepID=UPI00240A43FC|nr:ParB/RepB/Spo0J family partition protein [Pseudomonas sp. GOM6]MDG1580934.1 ParB/RepB/Spo0J family partition protein [Pseudomonas sp. GOM6]